MNIELTCTLFTMAHIGDAINCLSASSIEDEEISKCIDILRRIKDDYRGKAYKLMAQEELE